MDVGAATGALTVGYNLFVLAFVLASWERVSSAPAHAALNGGVILTVLLLGRLRKARIFSLLHLWHPLALYPVLYYQTGLLNRILVPGFLDPLFLRADIAVFGTFPAVYLHRALRGPFADEFFHFAYFSYYLVIVLVALLLFRKSPGVFQRFLFQLSALFYLCYVVYVFLPVEGPLVQRGLFFHGSGLFEGIVDFLYAKGENPGAAFPSSHVAVALLVALWGGTHFPRLRPLLLAQFVLLSTSALYCSFHYGVDIIAGVLLGAGLLVLMNRSPDLFWHGQRRRPPSNARTARSSAPSET
ncbi:MAG: phosphatase PAP2 family protein [Proteobacteria bacterium]|nr:phosphatase PAP2 family protein [Pseudomonadota bacterium]